MSDIIPALTVLILDERRIYRDMLAVLFERHGITVVQAANGNEASVRLREHRVGLLIMDVELGGMHGLEFLNRLRQNQTMKNLPVMIVTDIREKAYILRASALGVRDYILRSCFAAERFMDRARQLLGLPRYMAPKSSPAVPSKAAGELLHAVV